MSDVLLIVLVAVAIPELALWWVEWGNGRRHEVNLRRLEWMRGSE